MERRRLIEDDGLPERLEEYIKRAGWMKMLELELLILGWQRRQSNNDRRSYR